MKISYLISCHNEAVQLRSLFYWINIHKTPLDEVIVLDDFSDEEYTKGVLSEYVKNNDFKVFQHALNADYGSHKNFGTKQCKGDYIFQIDGDERPNENILGENLHSIIESNPEIELIFVPRINDYKGVTEEHARQWGWRLTNSKSDGVAQGRPLVNAPDFQGRIFKNVPDRIKWDRKLHEKIEGHNQYSFLPAEEEYALYHDKTIEKQLETNLRYNKVFTVEDNMGHKVI